MDGFHNSDGHQVLNDAGVRWRVGDAAADWFAEINSRINHATGQHRADLVGALRERRE